MLVTLVSDKRTPQYFLAYFCHLHQHLLGKVGIWVLIWYSLLSPQFLRVWSALTLAILGHGTGEVSWSIICSCHLGSFSNNRCWCIGLLSWTLQMMTHLPDFSVACCECGLEWRPWPLCARPSHSNGYGSGILQSGWSSLQPCIAGEWDGSYGVLVVVLRWVGAKNVG